MRDETRYKTKTCVICSAQNRTRIYGFMSHHHSKQNAVFGDEDSQKEAPGVTGLVTLVHADSPLGLLFK